MENTQLAIQEQVGFIDGIQMNSIQGTMSKIKSFQELIHKTLIAGTDYGTIPGCGDKPTLKKPGAEKVIMLSGVTSEYTVTKQIEDYDIGFFAYTVKSVLSKNGIKITEGLGSCNTREKKYINHDPYTLANTCLKMAKKRAQVDATLTIASLSDRFTQDIEDFKNQDTKKTNGSFNGNGNGNGNSTNYNSNKAPSEKQIAYYEKLCKGLNFSAIEAFNYASGLFGRKISSITDMNLREFSKLIDNLKTEEIDRASKNIEDENLTEAYMGAITRDELAI